MLRDFAAKKLAEFIRRQAGTPSTYDGIRRLASAGFGERSILPGILLNTITLPGQKRTEQDVQSVIDTLQYKQLGDGGQLYPRVSEGFYRKVTDYSHTQRYWDPVTRSSEVRSTFGNDRSLAPSQPWKPLSPNPTTPPATRSTLSGGLSLSPLRPSGVVGGSRGGPLQPPRGPVPPVPPGDNEWDGGWSDPVEVESSHIFSIAYNERSNQCAVTFRMPSDGMVVVGAVPSLCSGEYNSWVKRKASPYVTYVYGNATKPFPLSLYRSFLEAPSKGRFLWENIRGCGDHIYPYTTFDIKADGSIFLPSYDGGINMRGGVGNGPSQPPGR